MAQSGMFKRTLVASGAAVLLSAGALGATSALADSSGSQAGGVATVVQAGAKAKGTPDGYAWNAYIKNHRYADVIWDDYTSNGADVDSLTIDDANLEKAAAVQEPVLSYLRGTTRAGPAAGAVVRPTWRRSCAGAWPETRSSVKRC